MTRIIDALGRGVNGLTLASLSPPFQKMLWSWIYSSEALR
jgi:hypothetical protein